MKKFLPLIMMGLLLSGLIGLQINLDVAGTNAQGAKKSDIERLELEQSFSKQVLTDLSGQEFGLQDEKAPIVILNFWATWCAPCIDKFKILNELRERFSTSEVLILGISGDVNKEASEVAKVVDKYGISFPIVLVGAHESFEAFRVENIPYTLIFHEGKLAMSLDGEDSFDTEKLTEKFHVFLGK